MNTAVSVPQIHSSSKSFRGIAYTIDADRTAKIYKNSIYAAQRFKFIYLVLLRTLRTFVTAISGVLLKPRIFRRSRWKEKIYWKRF